MTHSILRACVLSAALFAGPVVLGCHHHDHDDDNYRRQTVYYDDNDHFYHRGYYDRDHSWHGGYDDDRHVYHADPRDWRHDRGDGDDRPNWGRNGDRDWHDDDHDRH